MPVGKGKYDPIATLLRNTTNCPRSCVTLPTNGHRLALEATRVVLTPSSRRARLPSPSKESTLARLKLVVHNPPNVTLSAWQEQDPIFFHRDQIRVGTRLTYFGRRRHGSEWEVTSIYTHTESGRRRYQDAVIRVNDTIVVKHVGSNETSIMSFNYMSYSSIWRLE